jgi:hypothetical protein
MNNNDNKSRLDNLKAELTNSINFDANSHKLPINEDILLTNDYLSIYDEYIQYMNGYIPPAPRTNDTVNKISIAQKEQIHKEITYLKFYKMCARQNVLTFIESKYAIRRSTALIYYNKVQNKFIEELQLESDPEVNLKYMLEKYEQVLERCIANNDMKTAANVLLSQAKLLGLIDREHGPNSFEKEFKFNLILPTNNDN